MMRAHQEIAILGLAASIGEISADSIAFSLGTNVFDAGLAIGLLLSRGEIFVAHRSQPHGSRRVSRYAITAAGRHRLVAHHLLRIEEERRSAMPTHEKGDGAQDRTRAAGSGLAFTPA